MSGISLLPWASSLPEHPTPLVSLLGSGCPAVVLSPLSSFLSPLQAVFVSFLVQDGQAGGKDWQDKGRVRLCDSAAISFIGAGQAACSQAALCRE